MGCVNDKPRKYTNNQPGNQEQNRSNLNPVNASPNQSNINRSDAGTRKKSLIRSNVSVQPGEVSSFKEKPKAKQAYTANSMIPIIPIDPIKFSGVNNFKVPNNPIMTRDQEYDAQARETTKSQLVQNIQLLKYDLDTQDGVSVTPMINTFQYKTVLNHNLYLESNQTFIRPTSSRVMNSEQNM